MSLAALPLFVRVAGRRVILLGEGPAADAKRRLLERAGAEICGEDAEAALAVVAMEAPEAAAARLRARGVLVNAVDRPDLCDFTFPAIVERGPVIVAVGTNGASAGLAAALRQRLEALLPDGLAALGRRLAEARLELRQRWPDATERRRQLAEALTEGGALDPLREHAPGAVSAWLQQPGAEQAPQLVRFALVTTDPDDLTLRQARALAQADRVFHRPDVPPAILDRARADAVRIACDAPPAEPGPGLSVDVELHA